MARTTISLPDSLTERLERVRDRVNMSKVCAAALERECDMLEMAGIRDAAHAMGDAFGDTRQMLAGLGEVTKAAEGVTKAMRQMTEERDRMAGLIPELQSARIAEVTESLSQAVQSFNDGPRRQIEEVAKLIGSPGMLGIKPASSS